MDVTLSILPTTYILDAQMVCIDPFVLTVGLSISMRRACSITLPQGNSFVLPKPYLEEMYIEHAQRLTTKGPHM